MPSSGLLSFVDKAEHFVYLTMSWAEMNQEPSTPSLFRALFVSQVNLLLFYLSEPQSPTFWSIEMNSTYTTELCWVLNTMLYRFWMRVWHIRFLIYTVICCTIFWSVLDHMWLWSLKTKLSSDVIVILICVTILQMNCLTMKFSKCIITLTKHTTVQGLSSSSL